MYSKTFPLFISIRTSYSSSYMSLSLSHVYRKKMYFNSLQLISSLRACSLSLLLSSIYYLLDAYLFLFSQIIDVTQLQRRRRRLALAFLV